MNTLVELNADNLHTYRYPLLKDDPEIANVKARLRRLAAMDVDQYRAALTLVLRSPAIEKVDINDIEATRTYRLNIVKVRLLYIFRRHPDGNYSTDWDLTEKIAEFAKGDESELTNLWKEITFNVIDPTKQIPRHVVLSPDEFEKLAIKIANSSLEIIAPQGNYLNRTAADVDIEVRRMRQELGR